MAHVTIRRDADNRSLAMPLREDTPLRIMRSMFGWDPVRGWDPFREVSPFLAESPLTASFSPTFEVKETKDAYLFRADVPGVHEKDLDVSPEIASRSAASARPSLATSRTPITPTSARSALFHAASRCPRRPLSSRCAPS